MSDFALLIVEDFVVVGRATKGKLSLDFCLVFWLIHVYLLVT